MAANLLDIFTLPTGSSAPETAIRDTLQLMACLHSVPKREQIPIIISGRIRSQGEYQYRTTVPNQPLRLVISRRATHPRMTLAHEIGHFLDNQVLHALKQGFASDYEEGFSPLKIVWEQSALVKSVRKILSHARISPVDRGSFRELISPSELWAATYAQWVATRSGNREFELELDREIHTPGYAGRFAFDTQWAPQEFKGIMALVDDLFRDRGLLW